MLALYIGRVGPKVKPQRVTPTVPDFRKNAKHLMCDLSTTWILESAQRLACALTIMLTQSSGERRA